MNSGGKFDLIQMRKSSLENTAMSSGQSEASAQQPRLSDVHEHHDDEHENEPLIKSMVDKDALTGLTSQIPASKSADLQPPYSNSNSITGSQRVKFFSDYNIKREAPLSAQPPSGEALTKPDDIQHIQRFDVIHVDAPVQTKLPPPGRNDKYFINENGSLIDLDSTKPKKPLSRETSGRKMGVRDQYSKNSDFVTVAKRTVL